MVVMVQILGLLNKQLLYSTVVLHGRRSTYYSKRRGPNGTESLNHKWHRAHSISMLHSSGPTPLASCWFTEGLGELRDTV